MRKKISRPKMPKKKFFAVFVLCRFTANPIKRVKKLSTIFLGNLLKTRKVQKKFQNVYDPEKDKPYFFFIIELRSWASGTRLVIILKDFSANFFLILSCNRWKNTLFSNFFEVVSFCLNMENRFLMLILKKVLVAFYGQKHF